MQHLRATDHAQPVRSHAMHENDRPERIRCRHVPAVQDIPGRTSKLDLLMRQRQARFRYGRTRRREQHRSGKEDAAAEPRKQHGENYYQATHGAWIVAEPWQYVTAN
jgi:hypothetical protein